MVPVRCIVVVDGGRLLAGVEPVNAPSRTAAVEHSITIKKEDWSKASLRHFWPRLQCRARIRCRTTAQVLPIFLLDSPSLSWVS